MAGFDYKQTYAWQEAMQLSQDVFSLIESLPEAAGPLGTQLAKLAVVVPAGIAENLVTGKPAQLGAVLPLSIAIELVDRIYPALDSSKAQQAVAKLIERMQSPTFTELVPAAPSQSAAVESDEASEDDDEAEVADEDEEPEEDEDNEEDEDETPPPPPTSVRVNEG